MKSKLTISTMIALIAVMIVMVPHMTFAESHPPAPPPQGAEGESQRDPPPQGAEGESQRDPPPQGAEGESSQTRNPFPLLDELRQVRSENYGERFENRIKNLSDERINELQTKYNNLRTGASPDENNRISPRQQMIIGVDAEEIICAQGHELILRTSNGMPACLTSNTASTWIERGLAIPVDGIDPLSITDNFFDNAPPRGNDTGVGNPPPLDGIEKISSTTNSSDNSDTYTDDNGNTITISGGHETDAVDGGRPVYLVGAILGITGEQFRDAFSYVTPEEQGHLNEETARANKAQLLEQLEPYGALFPNCKNH